ncbi:MAG: hypothetical protein ACD_3C00229G0005 [uncultured bacterium (gcode 4)]|uniref:Uncharacterized protein n=1 Tax=uncultured bacterium (gcode 4) TaxID=1234023 RepID=K2GAT1_9BACT|nr:MAG: hypothetical protein ACD_3C00229G0005 [uncultured bacterium (gcode 4)]
MFSEVKEWNIINCGLISYTEKNIKDSYTVYFNFSVNGKVASLELNESEYNKLKSKISFNS